MKKVIRFTAPWCGPCRTVAPILAEMAQKYSDKAIFQTVDIDNDPVTAKKYGVSSIPTVVIEVNGVETQRFVGVKPKNLYESAINN